MEVGRQREQEVAQAHQDVPHDEREDLRQRLQTSRR
jgi:hypothetical protein